MSVIIIDTLAVLEFTDFQMDTERHRVSERLIRSRLRGATGKKKNGMEKKFLPGDYEVVVGSN